MTRTKKYKRAGMLQLPASVKPEPTPEVPSFDSLPVKKAQVDKAVQALSAHLNKTKSSKESKELISTDEHVFLVVTLKEMDAKAKTMPVRIPLPHSLVDKSKHSICLFTKDPQREYKDLLDAKGINFVNRVIGVEKLKGKFKPFEARRELMDNHDLFLADDRIIPTLPKLLGRKWVDEKKRQPIPVRLTKDDLPSELERAIQGTSLVLNRGTCLTVKVATFEQHEAKQWADNITALIPHLAARLPRGGWENVQALHLKSSSSLSLPLWSCDLGSDRFSQSKLDQPHVLPIEGAEAEEDDDDEELEDLDKSEIAALKKEAEKSGAGSPSGQKRKRGAAAVEGAEGETAGDNKTKTKKVKADKPAKASSSGAGKKKKAASK